MKSKAKRYNKLPLSELADAVESKQCIDVSNQDSLNADKIIVIKRSGKKEPFTPEKMHNACLWACENKMFMVEQLINDTEIKLHKEIHIKDMFQQLIVTAVNKISMLQPQWEEVAGKLELMKIYKETYNMSKASEYPHLADVLKKGLDRKIYDKQTLSSYTDEEIEELNEAIDPERDLLFNYKGLVSFYDKYCLHYSNTTKLELPQLSYMRVSMALMANEVDRVKYIIKMYDAISNHNYTKATPIMLNSLTPGQQLSSCVLNTIQDDSHNILDTGKNLGIYSKHKGGTAVDITDLRAKGSYIEGNQGISSGPVPFLKVFEAVMKAWNQGSKRPGALAVYFSWWHLDVEAMLSLKGNGGTDENRARGLKYGLKIHRYFEEAVRNNEDIYLFDPVDVPDLIGKYGEEFNTIYEEYCNKVSIRKTKMNARDLWEKSFKERSETGNIYLFHEENVNEASLLNRYIGSSNLCTEITLPSRPSELINEELVTMEDGDKRIIKRYTAGEIALCNLSSVNLERWFYMDEETKMDLIRTLVRGLDNTIDLANYPVKEGKNSNNMYRYLGIGVLNYANYLALKEICIDTAEAAEETDALFDELSYMIISASVELAIEKGKFEKFHETEWSKGVLPIHKANEKAKLLTKYEPDWDKWNDLSERVQRFGLRNAQLMAIAPTATSGKAINAMESTEPMPDFFYKEEGTIIVPTVVPNFRKNSLYYKKAFDCDQYALIRNAAIRQKWLDQSQSVNTYIGTPDSLIEMTKMHMYGFSLGLKTFYYQKQLKSTYEDSCPSCT